MTLPRTLSGNAVGALWMLASAACFTAMATCLKLLAQAQFPESQMVFFRCAAGMAAILPFILRAPRSTWAVKRPGKVILRCALSTLGFFAGFYSFAHMPLADAQAISFSRVLFITVFAVWLLKEAVGWRRWAAVGVGFVGVLLMLQPAGEAGFGLAAMAALASSVLFGLTIVTVKDLTADHSTLSLVFYTNAFTTLAGLPFAFLAWKQPDLATLALFIGMGFAGVGAQSCYVRALSTGEASLLGMIDYVRLPLAVGVGYLLFAEIPSVAMLAGAFVIVASTLYITVRESRSAKPLPVAAPLSGADKEVPP
ncbi:MAG: DMT family transporter [Hyphomonadaceae bacterium]|nr:DMT family transporter [Hyphomonadaceae bacterium]